MNVDIKITNLREIRSAFNKSPMLMTRYLNVAIQKSLFKIRQQSTINTPVDTGRLRGSHYTRFSNLRGEVGTSANYGIFVHEGTRYMKARPYLRTAVEDHNQTIGEYFEEAVQKVLDEIGDKV